MRKFILGLVVAAACSESTGTANPCTDAQKGPFTGDAAVAASGSLAGCASYGVAASSGSTVTALTLSSGSPTNPSLVVNLIRNGTRPATGAYAVGANAGDFAGSIFLSVGNRTFNLSSGSVTIDVSSLTGAEGTLRGSLDVTGLATGSNEQLQVTGEFTAKCTAGGSITC